MNLKWQLFEIWISTSLMIVDAQSLCVLTGYLEVLAQVVYPFDIGWSIFLYGLEGFEYVLHKPSARSVDQDYILSLWVLCICFLNSFFVCFILLSCLFLRKGLKYFRLAGILYVAKNNFELLIFWFFTSQVLHL